MAKKQETEGYGVASLVLGILSIIIGWYPFLGLIFVIPAIVFGHMQQKRNKIGIATAGLVMGYVILGIQIIFLMLTIIGLIAISMGY